MLLASSVLTGAREGNAISHPTFQLNDATNAEQDALDSNLRKKAPDRVARLCNGALQDEDLRG